MKIYQIIKDYNNLEDDVLWRVRSCKEILSETASITEFSYKKANKLLNELESIVQKEVERLQNVIDNIDIDIEF